MLFMSCVNRIDIPEEEDSHFYINLEMVTGQNTLVADFKTSNNLNGTYPISIPEFASITIKELNPSSQDVNNERELIYDEISQKYVNNFGKDFLKLSQEYELVAKMDNSGLEEITATTIVPRMLTIKKTELVSESEYTDIDGNRYWEGTVGLTFLKAAGNNDRFGHLVLKGLETERNITPEGDTIYINGMESRLFKLLDIEVGRGAITDLIHKDGFLIDFTKLEDEYLEIVLRSPFPITKPNHVTNFLHSDIYAVTKAHHDYHVALHNIKKSQGSIFDEHALYHSNIKNGLGLFSSCTFKGDILELR
jgi:hypothetical protein